MWALVLRRFRDHLDGMGTSDQTGVKDDDDRT
jgi:hypothetical protein